MNRTHDELRAALLVHNFAPGTEFAWGFIGELMNTAARTFQRHGLGVVVSFPDAGKSTEQPTGTSKKIVWDPGDSSWQNEWRLLRLIRAHRIAVVYLTDQPLLHRRYAIWRLAGVKRVIVHDHTSGTRPPMTAFRRLIKQIAWKIPGLGADLTIGVSEFVVTRLRDIGCVPDERRALVRNGVRIPSDITHQREDGSDEANTAHVVAIARATPVKGIDVLLNAWRRVIDRWPGTRPAPRLRYAGDGPMMSRLRELVSELNLQSHVDLLGYRRDVDTLFRDADICVVPSVWEEAFCLVVAEAMSWGVPVVATDAGAIPEVLGKGTGMLVPPGNTEALADALYEMLMLSAAERENMGRLARARAIDALTLSDTFVRFEAVLSDAVAPLTHATV